MHDLQHIKTLDLYSDVSLSFIGPPLQEGPLPALFYFALAAHESLGVDPYNQPAVYLASLPVRIFSMDIPKHGLHLSSQDALKNWAEDMRQGKNVITEFVELVAVIIEDLIVKNIVQREKCAIAGLSRGCLIAAHIAARCKDIRWILGFAPLTKLSHAKEFQEIKDSIVVDRMNIENLTSSLTDRTVRFYIGNCDQRVGTRNCFDFIEKLSEEMYASRIRSPNVELIISPSVGFQGHGTSKQTFHHGAQWIVQQMDLIHVH